MARASGARDLTLAFLQTPKKGSCSVTWNGITKQPVRPGGRYTAQITKLRAMGGDVVPSFGGYSADQGGTEIADSCRSVPAIARAYESVVTTYGVTRLDMDVEANSLNKPAGIARRSAALRLLQDWAARTHRHVRITFTLGVEPWGLPANCLAILKSAVAQGVRFTVNIMAFDYYIKASKTGIEMGTAAIQALDGTHRQLGRLYPGLSQPRLWALEGITLLPGIDDYPKKTEVTYLQRRPAGRPVRPRPPAAAGLHLGHPARQRRLPGHHRQQLLLRHPPAAVGVQPPPGALRRPGRAPRCGTRRPGDRQRSRMRSRCGSYSGAICSRTGMSPAGVRARKSPFFSQPPVTPSAHSTWASPTAPPTV